MPENKDSDKPNPLKPLTWDDYTKIKSNWPETPEAWCDYWKIMDIQWGTNSASPLHHDSKCKLH